jgi:hypothetical protein
MHISEINTEVNSNFFTKITEVENSVQGVGNLFDNLKSDCDKNKTEVTKVGKKFDSLKPYCEKNKSGSALEIENRIL